MQPANELLHAYLQVSRLVTEELRGHFGQLNLTFPQTLVLTLLESDGPMPISALAKATGSANSTTSGVVDRLERMQLLRRVRSEEDRRVIYVEVTDQYRALRQQSTAGALERFSQSVSSLSQTEIDEVIHAFELLRTALEQSRQTKDS